MKCKELLGIAAEVVKLLQGVPGFDISQFKQELVNDLNKQR